MQRSYSSFRTLGIVVMLVLAASLCLASTLCAQSEDPVQPEITQAGGGAGPSVDPFSGSFSFGLPVISIPGPEGSGTSLTLSYRAGTPANAGATWVGYGWTLNPGAIVRDARGIPDDWTDTITYHNRRPESVTLNLMPRFGLELASDTMDTASLGGLSFSLNLSYNRNSGYFVSRTTGVNAIGIGGVQMMESDTGLTFSGNLDPSFTKLAGSIADSNTTLTNVAGQLIAGQVNQAIRRANASPWANTETPYSGITTDYQLALTLSAPWPYIYGLEFGLTGLVTRINTQARHRLRALGYLYTSKAYDNPDAAKDQQDYHLDRDVPFTSNVKLLPIPVSDPDQFNVIGGGSFRLFNSRIGIYRPNEVEATIAGFQGGGNVTVLGRYGLGVDFGFSGSENSTSGWKYDPWAWLTTIVSIGIPPAGSEARYNSFAFSQGWVGDNAVARFANDIGGHASYAQSIAPERADADIGPIPPAGVTPQLNNGNLAGRSTYVGFRTNRELTEKSGSSQVPYRAWGGDSLVYRRATYLNRFEDSLQNQIGEFVVLGGDGSRYVYGLPVYQRNYTEMFFGLPSISFDSAGRIQSQHRAFAWRHTHDAQDATGRELNTPSAVAWLLTEVYAPGYIDRTNDGPTPDDYGGYTLYRYNRTAGSTMKSNHAGDWYRWRVPYSGLTYDRRSPFEPEDDIGTMSMAEREVYYLESIETKTHAAYFVNNRSTINVNIGGTPFVISPGMGGERFDGYPAGADIGSSADPALLEQAMAGDSTATDARWDTVTSAPRSNPSRYLQRIELYAKDPQGGAPKILGVTHFEYDYSLRRGLRSSLPQTSSSHDTDRAGMLTLRRVWFQNQNVIPAKIAPWDFHYEYRKASEYPAEARSMYPEIVHFADSLDTLEQNPRWTPFQIDAWGNYQADGAARFAAGHPWVDQNPDTAKFDPAAWQLKGITTPSQGEIEIQYEQNRYGYVQDRPAMGMVSLLSTFGGGSASTDNDATNHYYLNLADVGIRDTVRDEVVRWHGLIKRMCRDSAMRVYFRLLYALNGNDASYTQPEFASDYVNGYGFIKELFLDSSGTSPKHYGIAVRIGSRTSDHSDDVPKTVCQNYTSAQRRGLDRENILPNGSDMSMLWSLLSKFGHAAFDRSEHCLDIDYEHSYLRLPLFGDKRGGGIRVRRLLTLDRGPDGDTTLYGSEYLYEGLDRQRGTTRTSGVATNEPEATREENPLVDISPGLLDDDLKNRLVAGTPLSVAEGPVGRTLLPGASIGYGRVVARSIYGGKSTPGFSIQEFYTAKDSPFDRWLPDLGQTTELTSVDRHDFNPIPSAAIGAFGVSVSYHQDLQSATQGSRFILQEMHGAPRRSAAYGGLYNDPASWVMTGMNETEYFAPGEGIPVVRRLGDAIRPESLGEEIDVTMEARVRSSNTGYANFEGDLSFGAGFLPTIGISKAKAKFGYDRRSLSTHTTSKVIRYPLIPKRTISFADGMSTVSENVAFDAATGAPVIRRSYDGYNGMTLQHSPGHHVGTYTSFTIPAGWEYPAMAQNAVSERMYLTSGDALAMVKGVSGPSTTVIFSGNTGVVATCLSRLGEGDMVRLTATSGGDYRGMYHVDTIIGTTVHLVPVAGTLAASNSMTGGVNLEVIRSGRSNAPGAPVGSFVTYGTSPEDVKSGRYISSGLSSGELGVRQQFVDSLNACLQRGGGIILPSSYPAGLELATSGGSCAEPTDTIRMEWRGGGVVVTRGRFSVVDSIDTSRAVATYLNRALDTLWGWTTSRTQRATDTLNNTGWRTRTLGATPMSWIERRDDRFDTVFAKINGRREVLPLRSFIHPSGTDQMTTAFKAGANPERLYGRMTLVGGVRADTVNLAIKPNPVTGVLADSLVSMWEQVRVVAGATVDSDSGTIHPLYLSDITGLQPATTSLVRFAQDAQGYLTVINLRSADTNRVFGLRFYVSDTTVLHTLAVDSQLVGGSGTFALDAYGRIIFVPADQVIRPTLLSGTQFCTDDTARLHVAGVLAAGATMLSDEHAIETESWMPVDGGNAFEHREKNVWTPLMSFAYRTDVVGGARQIANERVYKNAGVFTDFALFDWQHPERNGVEWMPGGDTVVLYSPLGMPLETRSRLGTPSAVRLGYDNSMPVIAGANANYSSIDFNSFEQNEDEADWGSDLVGFGHGGKQSYRAVPPMESDTLVEATITQQAQEQGFLVRFWARPSYESLISDGDVVVRMTGMGGTADTVLAERHRVARTGKWSLFEVLFRPVPGMLGQKVIVRVQINSDTGTFWVDDIVIAPRTAEVVCMVYDPITRRVVATFDNNHFGIYPQYNAEGLPVRTIVETSHGLRTVAEAHANIPRVNRVPGAGFAAERRDDPISSSSVAALSPASDLMLGEGEKMEYQSPNFSLTNVEITPDRMGVRFPLFDSAGSALDPAVTALTKRLHGLGDVQQLGRLEQLYARADSLGQAAETLDGSDAATVAARTAIEQERTALLAQGARLLKRLRMSEEEARRLIEAVQSAKPLDATQSEVHSGDPPSW